MLEKIKEVMVESMNIDPELIVPEARLEEDLEMDSLSAVELAMELENTFDIQIEDDALANLKTVQDIMTLIESHQA